LIQDTSRNVKISLTQADHGIVNKSTNEKTGNCKNIYLFRKYAYTFRTVRIYATLYERDRIISNNKVTKSKKYRKMEWCINVKKKKKGLHALERNVKNKCTNDVLVLRIFKYVIIEM
jgi:hypothetical protein